MLSVQCVFKIIVHLLLVLNVLFTNVRTIMVHLLLVLNVLFTNVKIFARVIRAHKAKQMMARLSPLTPVNMKKSL